jgi:hypothetical protein
VSKESFTHTPPSSHCKFHLFVKQTYSPYTLASAGFEATWAQATAQWPQYGGGMAGFGKRFGATLAVTECENCPLPACSRDECSRNSVTASVSQRAQPELTESVIVIPERQRSRC